MTKEIIDLIAKKYAAEGTAEETEARDRCSEKMAHTKADYVHKTKQELEDMKEGSKQWWRTSSELLGAPSKICYVPALKDGEGNWVKDPGPKASLMAKTFGAKYKLAAKEENEYSKINTNCQREYCNNAPKN